MSIYGNIHTHLETFTLFLTNDLKAHNSAVLDIE